MNYVLVSIFATNKSACICLIGQQILKLMLLYLVGCADFDNRLLF